MLASRKEPLPSATMQDMIETLYKTETPENGRSECYVLVLTPRPASDRKVYSFMEEHGKWDESLMRFLYQVTSISTDGEMTHEEALAMYNTAKRKLAQGGFVHAFVPAYTRKMPHAYELFQPESATA
jgi:hypothetical protein